MHGSIKCMQKFCYSYISHYNKHLRSALASHQKHAPPPPPPPQKKTPKKQTVIDHFNQLFLVISHHTDRLLSLATSMKSMRWELSLISFALFAI